MRLKQNISTVLYLLISACLFAGVMFLGSNYIADNTADVNTAVNEELAEDTVSTDDFPADSNEPEPEITIEETQDMIDETEEDTDAHLSELIDSLYLLLAEEAPFRWEKYEEADWSRVRYREEADETAETNTETTDEKASESISDEEEAVSAVEPHPEFVEMYPKLAYFYKDLNTGKIVSYNADEILYSASLIKAPYIFAVIEEIDHFVKSKLPEEEPEETSLESESFSESAAETDAEIAETDAEITDSSEEPEETEVPEETKSIWEMIEYTPWEKKYDLSTVWTYDPSYMYVEGSGELLDMPGGVQLTWLELFEYALLYSDNIAFDQIRQRFGSSSFYQKVEELDIQGTERGFMQLSARDCGIFLEAMYEYFASGSELASHMRDTMADSKKLNLIASHYPDGMAPHKYGWDLEAFHDMAIIYDENPYILVIMTDYEDGGKVPTQFFADVVDLTKQIHEEIHKNDPKAEENETSVTKESNTVTDDLP